MSRGGAACALRGLAAGGLLWLAVSCAPAGARIQPRRALAAATLNGAVYITGGWNGEATQLDTVETFDGRAVRAAPPMLIARSQHALIAADGALFALGGWSATRGLVAEVERFDPAAGRWQLVGRLPTPRREPAAAVLGREIVVTGGFNGVHDGDLDGFSDAVEALHLDSGQWRALPPLHTARRGHAMAAGAAGLVVAGGFNPAEREHRGFLAQAEHFDAATQRWQPLTLPLLPRTWLAAAMDGDALMLIGGHNAGGPLDVVERVSLRDGDVCRAPPLASARAWLAVSAQHGRLLAVGGESAAGFVTSIDPVETACVARRMQNTPKPHDHTAPTPA